MFWTLIKKEIHDHILSARFCGLNGFGTDLPHRVNGNVSNGRDLGRDVNYIQDTNSKTICIPISIVGIG